MSEPSRPPTQLPSSLRPRLLIAIACFSLACFAWMTTITITRGMDFVGFHYLFLGAFVAGMLVGAGLGALAGKMWWVAGVAVGGFVGMGALMGFLTLSSPAL